MDPPGPPGSKGAQASRSSRPSTREGVSQPLVDMNDLLPLLYIGSISAMPKYAYMRVCAGRCEPAPRGYERRVATAAMPLCRYAARMPGGML